MRLAVYTDYPYHRQGATIYAERAFAVFLSKLAESLGATTIVGRLDPNPGRARYPIPANVEFVALPFYESLARPLPALLGMARSLRRLWSSLDDVDAVWLIGPNPLALPFAVVAALRRRRVILGVRQDTPAYVRNRHPDRRLLNAAARFLDRSYRLLARRCPTVVVGPELASRYAHAERLLEITVSLIGERDLVDEAEALSRSYAGELTILSVGRLDQEKNPLMLAEVLAALHADEPGRWRLDVYGEGTLESDLRARLDGLELSGVAELRGYVPLAELQGLYRRAHMLLATSWTEGFPQVVVEALAAGLPVVATDVGGIRGAAGDAVALIAPGDIEGAVAALRLLVSDPGERERLVKAGLEYAREHTTEREVAQLAEFLAGACP